MMTETRECGICMDKAASLRCQRCSYVFCDECCEKLATYKHIRRCIHCNQQHPWIKSLDPESMLSENITKLIASPDIENPLANNAGGANIETANQRYRREQEECCWSRVVFFFNDNGINYYGGDSCIDIGGLRPSIENIWYWCTVYFYVVWSCATRGYVYYRYIVSCYWRTDCKRYRSHPLPPRLDAYL